MRVYLDNNATTAVDSQVFREMKPFFVEKFGNPNSLHAFASETHKPLKNAMEKLYAGINARREDSVVVTSCATESNNWVLKSIYFEYILTGRKNHIIVSGGFGNNHPIYLAYQGLNFIWKFARGLLRSLTINPFPKSN